MNPRHVLGSLLAFATIVAACDEERKPTPPAASAAPAASSVPVASSAPAPSASAPPEAPLTPDAFCARLFGNVYADFAKACSEDDKKSDGFKLAELVARMPLEECDYVVRDGVASGRMTFDPAAAARCAEAGEKTKKAMKGVHLATPDIDELEECKAVVTGKQGDGQACRSTLECSGTLTCIGAHDKKDGACKAPPTKAGEPCDGAAWKHHDLGHRHRCGPGLACDIPDFKTMASVCRKAATQGAACRDSDECEEGLACHAGKCDAGPPASAGGACEDDVDDCKDGLYCKRDKGKKLGVCTDKKVAGQPCADVFECRGECRKTTGNERACAAVCGSG